MALQVGLTFRVLGQRLGWRVKQWETEFKLTWMVPQRKDEAQRIAIAPNFGCSDPRLLEEVGDLGVYESFRIAIYLRS